MYAGTSGSTHGERNESTPAPNARTALNSERLSISNWQLRNSESQYQSNNRGTGATKEDGAYRRYARGIRREAGAAAGDYTTRTLLAPSRLQRARSTSGV